MPRIEQETRIDGEGRDIVLQEFTFKNPSKHQLKDLFFRLGTEMTLNPSLTRGIIQGEWFDRANGHLLARASMELWNTFSPVKLSTLDKASFSFAQCSKVKILEILSL